MNLNEPLGFVSKLIGIMMRALFLVCFLSFNFTLFSQVESNIDPRLEEVYDASYLERMQDNHPVILQRMNYYLDNAFFITDFPEEKGSPDFPVIQVEDLSTINILQLEEELGLVRNFEQRTFYQIAGTEKVLVYYSGKEFTEAFNEYRQHTAPADEK